MYKLKMWLLEWRNRGLNRKIDKIYKAKIASLNHEWLCRVQSIDIYSKKQWIKDNK